MKRISLLVILFSLVLTACAALTPTAAPSTDFPVFSATVTVGSTIRKATPTPIRTETSTPTKTGIPIPPTETEAAPKVIIQKEGGVDVKYNLMKPVDVNGNTDGEGYFKDITPGDGIPFMYMRGKEVLNIKVYVELGTPGAESIKSLVFGPKGLGSLSSKNYPYIDNPDFAINQKLYSKKIISTDQHTDLLNWFTDTDSSTGVVPFEYQGATYNFAPKLGPNFQIFVRNPASLTSDSLKEYSYFKISNTGKLYAKNSGISPEGEILASFIPQENVSLKNFQPYDWRYITLYHALKIFISIKDQQVQSGDASLFATQSGDRNPPWIVVNTNP